MDVRSSYPHNKVNGIVNLSYHNLTSKEIHILNLGHSFVSKPSNFNPNQTKKQLGRIMFNRPAINEILSDLQNINFPSILNTQELHTLNSLRNNNDLVITRADKGDSWVLLNKSDYITECERQLGDNSVYIPLPAPETNLNVELFREILLILLHNKFITSTEFKELNPLEEDLSYRIFYTLPKIHKPASTWPIKYKIPSGRPIIGNSNTEDTHICRFIDKFLKCIVEKQPYILCNSEQVMHKLSERVTNPNVILFTLDVASLYTNIPIQKGLEAVKFYFDKFVDRNRPDDLIISLLKISLTKNDFVFNKKYYRQVKGVAMGKQYAPNFANLYLCRWEEHVLNNLPGAKPQIWLRYIDDIFGLWEGSLDELLNFITFINNFDKNIQVTANTSFSDIQFLDLVIYKKVDFRLGFMVYLKPTSSLKLIHPKSLHPKHTKTGVIVSQILRYVKNCTFESDFLHHFRFLKVALMEQGYSRTWIKRAKKQAFVNSNYAVNSHGVILKGFFPCTDKCSVCNVYGIARNYVEFSGKSKLITQNLTCASKNVIYVIQCKKCSLRYVGETSRKVKERIGQHLSNIRLKYNTPISEHFNLNGHNILDFSFFALVNNNLWTESKRKIVENKWIEKLKTLKPNGINTDINKVRNKFVTVPFKGRNSLPNSLHCSIDDNTMISYTTGSPLRVCFNHKHKIARQ